jgi:hypothetical protein
MAGRIDRTALPGLIRNGLSTAEIARRFGVNAPAVTRACHADGLPLPGSVGAADDRPHAAAVRMPTENVQHRPDYFDLMAALRRSGGSAVAIGQVAARFRLPYAVLNGMVMRGDG